MKNRTCEVCGTTGSIKQLENHRKKGLCEQTLWRKQVDKLLEKNGGELRCPECETSFGKVYELYNHIRVTLCGDKLGLKPSLATCPHCKKSFAKPQSLKIHLANRSCRTPTCEYCGQEFKSKPTLAAHIRKGCPKAEKQQKELSLDAAAIVNVSKAPVYGDRHQCLFCSELFPAPIALERHMRSHTGERPFFCPECNNEFATKYSMKRHQKSHQKKADKRVKKGPVDKLLEENGESLACLHCKNNFAEIKCLRVHYLYTSCGIQLGLQRQSSTCPHCKKSFVKPQNLNVHLARGSCRTPTCEICGHEFDSKGSLAAHIKKGCLVGVELVVPSSLDAAASAKVSKSPGYGERHQCIFCSKFFRRPSALERHMRSHTGERPYFCPECGKEFVTRGSTQQHRELHKKPPKKEPVDELLEKDDGSLTCQQCNGKFPTIKNLRVHLMYTFCGIKLGLERSLPTCPDCNESFINTQVLNRHIAAASCKTPKCKDCGKEFERALSLTAHVRSGCLKGEDGTCKECGEVFYDKIRLEKHLLNHKLEAAAQVAAANAKASRALKNIDRYQCLFCSKRFQSSSGLGRHMRSHTKEKPYFCPECNKEFSSKSSMQKHYECKHLWVRAAEMESWEPVDPDAEDHYYCGRCDYVGPSQSAMIKHVKLIHHLVIHPDATSMWEQGFKKEDLSPDIDPSWKVEGTCYVCGKNFYCSGLLLIHIRRCEKKHKVWDVIGSYRCLISAHNQPKLYQ